MQNITQEYTIGFYDSSGVFSIYAKQDDLGRMLKFHLYDDNLEDYRSLLSDPSLLITVREQLPSGVRLPDVPVDVSQAVDLDDLSVTIPLTQLMLQESGTAICELVFSNLDGEYILSTVQFKLIIASSFAQVDPHTKELYDTWTELYIKINQEIDEAYSLLNEISESAVKGYADEAHMWADGNTPAEHPEDTPSATNNAKYYSLSAKASEQEANLWATGGDPEYSIPGPTNNAMYYAGQAMGASGIFNGTVAEWEALPVTDKNKITTVILIDG